MDTYPGYPVMRAWFPWEAAGFAAQKMKPDVAVVQAHKSVPIAKALQAHNVPTVVYLRNVEFLDLEGDLREIPSALYIANSEFTAGAFHDKFGIESIVIPPTIDPKKYATPTTGDYVTFINPFDEKGGRTRLEACRCLPRHPVPLVESWKMSDSQRSALEKRSRGCRMCGWKGAPTT